MWPVVYEQRQTNILNDNYNTDGACYGCYRGQTFKRVEKAAKRLDWSRPMLAHIYGLLGERTYAKQIAVVRRQGGFGRINPIWCGQKYRKGGQTSESIGINIGTHCLSLFANCRSQFLLDFFGICLKLFVRTESTAFHEFAYQFGLAICFMREKHPTTCGHRVACASVYLNEPAAVHLSPATSRKEALTASRLHASDPSKNDNTNGDGRVCVCAWGCACARVRMCVCVWCVCNIR